MANSCALLFFILDGFFTIIQKCFFFSGGNRKHFIIVYEYVHTFAFNTLVLSRI